jgi:hypothetical protein
MTIVDSACETGQGTCSCGTWAGPANELLLPATAATIGSK